MSVVQVCTLSEMGKGRAVYGNQHVLIEGFSYDSRTSGPGQVFVGVSGENCNGSDYALSALKQGASAVVIDRQPTQTELSFASTHDRGIIEAHDIHGFLSSYITQRLAQLKHPIVVGITGSHGKTSTKELTASVLAQRYKTHATHGNLNSLYGLAHTLLTAQDDCDVLVLEMGMDRLGEIAEQASLVRPTIGVLTNISEAHINTLGSVERIAQAKFELLSNLHPHQDTGLAPTALLPQNSPFSQWMIARLQDQGITYRLVNQVTSDDVTWESAFLNHQGCAQATLVDQQGNRADVRLNLLGMYNLENALFAAQVGALMDVPLDLIARGLSLVYPPAMRGETYQTPSGLTLIDDSYNANPVSMKAMLTMFGARKVEGRRIAVLGEMKGLGDEQKTFDAHAEIGALIAKEHLADYLIAVGALNDAYAQGALNAGMSPQAVLCAATVEQAVELLTEIAKPQDCIVAKASRSERLDRVIAAMKGDRSC